MIRLLALRFGTKQSQCCLANVGSPTLQFLEETFAEIIYKKNYYIKIWQLFKVTCLARFSEKKIESVVNVDSLTLEFLEESVAQIIYNN